MKTSDIIFYAIVFFILGGCVYYYYTNSDSFQLKYIISKVDENKYCVR